MDGLSKRLSETSLNKLMKTAPIPCHRAFTSGNPLHVRIKLLCVIEPTPDFQRRRLK
jgi:hypothetical protein